MDDSLAESEVEDQSSSDSGGPSEEEDSQHQPSHSASPLLSNLHGSAV